MIALGALVLIIRSGDQCNGLTVEIVDRFEGERYVVREPGKGQAVVMQRAQLKVLREAGE